MMERRNHNNLWAEKLSQVSGPDSGEAWKAMEALLDKKMPTDRKKDRRRLLLLLLLLLLLIGVCNCPGRGRYGLGVRGTRNMRDARDMRGARDGRDRRGKLDALDTGDARDMRGTGDGLDGRDTRDGRDMRDSRNMGEPRDTAAILTKGGLAVREGLAVRNSGEGVEKRGSTGKWKRREWKSGDSAKGLMKGGLLRGGKTKGYHEKKRRRGKKDPGLPGNADNVLVGDELLVSDELLIPVVSSGHGGLPAKKPGLPSLAKLSFHRGIITGKKLPVNAAKKEKQPDKIKDNGWMIGVGLNQFFTVGGQQASDYNSGGITGKLSDYIPVPMVRYYINRNLYIQLEAQFNTPQYTKKNLEIDYVKPDTSRVVSGQVVTVTHSASLKKLFYFNIPLSVHYHLFDHVDLGTGLQFSRLSNAIGTFDDSYSSAGLSDSTVVATKSFKSDTLYQKLKTNEFRFLVDVSYTWKGFVFGLRYNQALSKFIDIRVQTGQVAQSRNSSLQIYLRYILWDTRKKPVADGRAP